MNATQIDIFAFSLGGMVAQDLTVRHPELVRRLVLTGTGPRGDNDRMVPSELSEDLHRRIKGSELIIYPDSGHGGIFQFHDQFAPVAVRFLTQ